MSFVSHGIRARSHFRHHVESNCAWEPETPDHEDAKLAVCETINRLGKGSADVEVPVGKWVADVLWTDGEHRVAFEIQRANYSWAKFTDKFQGYLHEGVAVVYLLIGGQFYVETDKHCFRLKDIERRLFVGHAEERRNYHYQFRRVNIMKALRVYRERLGNVAGGYLRRSLGKPETLLVREPVFYPQPTKAGELSVAKAYEVGAAVSLLERFLDTVHDTFLAQPGHVFWRDRWFSRREEAVGAYFFSALGLSFFYGAETNERPSAFRFNGRYQLVASLANARSPRVPDQARELWLAAEPKLEQGFLCLGTLANAHVSDAAILGCYTRDTPFPVVDFSQLNQDFSGAVSGLHDGGAPGGNMGANIAEQAYDLWHDGHASLARGVPVPLSTPTLRPGYEYPVLRLRS